MLSYFFLVFKVLLYLKQCDLPYFRQVEVDDVAQFSQPEIHRPRRVVSPVLCRRWRRNKLLLDCGHHCKLLHLLNVLERM